LQALVGLWLTALNVNIVFKHLVPFLYNRFVFSPWISSDVLQIILRSSGSILSQPDGGVIDGFRWCFFGDKTPIYWNGMFVSLAVIIIFLLVGIHTFRKMEKSFADLI
jgi:lipopolysaccharide transport system permease protein